MKLRYACSFNAMGVAETPDGEEVRVTDAAVRDGDVVPDTSGTVGDVPVRFDLKEQEGTHEEGRGS